MSARRTSRAKADRAFRAEVKAVGKSCDPEKGERRTTLRRDLYRRVGRLGKPNVVVKEAWIVTCPCWFAHRIEERGKVLGLTHVETDWAAGKNVRVVFNALDGPINVWSHRCVHCNIASAVSGYDGHCASCWNDAALSGISTSSKGGAQ